MEEKKFDLNSLIGFVLLGAIMIWWMYTNQPTPEELAAEKAKTEQVEKAASTDTKNEVENTPIIVQENDSIALAKAEKELGSFAYAASLPSASNNGETVLENDLLKLVISNKGGQIKEALIKKYVTYDSLPLYIVKDIKKGEVFTEQHVRSIRPGNGIPPKYLDDVLGAIAQKDLTFGTPVSFEHYI